MEALDKEYKEIPMSEIDEEARLIALRWSEHMTDDFISYKVKLASDLMNYARRKCKEQREACSDHIMNECPNNPTFGEIEKYILETPLVI